MTEFEYKTIGYSYNFIASQFPRRFKRYKRGNKMFWRDYKRDIEGGITSLDLMRLKMDECQKQMIDNFTTSVYS